MQTDIPFKTAARSAPPSAPAAPWWRFGMVWLVLSGPAVVVVAGFATMAIAFRHADTVLHEAPVAASLAPPATGAAAAPPHTGATTTAPALQARNHAATPPR